MKIEVNSP